MKLKLYILSLLLLCTNLLYAADPKFTVSVSKTEVGTTEQFEVTFTVNTNATNFTAPSFNGFLVVSGPNTSQSMSMINGVTSSSVAFSFDLIAVKEGTYTIGAATIVVNGKQLSTNPVKIKVVKGAAAPQNNNQAQAQAQNGPDPRINSGKPGDISKNLFILAAVNKTSAYIGEQLTLSYRLYTRVAIVNNELEKLSDLNGFYSQDIKVPDQTVHWRVETYKGLKYNVTDIKQNILSPEHAGDITIGPMIMDFIVREAAASQSRDPFDQFFGGYNDVKYKIKSVPVVIHVKPLPETGKQLGFSGAVGKFTISASVDKTELKANEPLNYKIKVTGSGNIKLLQAPSPNFPADFEKYDPKTTDTIVDNEHGSSGSKFYNYLLIPRHGGNFTIEPLKFAYFDLNTHHYVNLQTAGFNIKVAKGVNENNVTSFGDKQDVKLLNKDIRYIKTNDGDIIKNGEGFYDSGLYYFLLLFGPLLFVGALIYGKWYEKHNSDIVKVKSRKASKIAAKHLASAQAQLSANNSKAFYENIFKGLYGYLSDKLNIAYADLNREKIAAELKARSLDEPLINELLDTLDLCDMARYAPVTGISEQQMFDKAKNMINDIENKI